MAQSNLDNACRLLDDLKGGEECLVEIRGVLRCFVTDLICMPRSQHGKAMLPLFKSCMLRINELDVDIETVERESLLDVLYRLGDMVGLSRTCLYLERWRGDW